MTTDDQELRDLIVRKRGDLHIQFRRWLKSKEAFGHFYDRLLAAGFTFDRRTRPNSDDDAA